MAKRKRGRRGGFRGIPWERARLYGLVVFAFAMPLFFLPGNTEYGFTKSILTLCAVSLLYILWGLEGLSRGRWELDLTWGIFPLLGLVAVSLISIAGGTPAGVVVQSATLLFYFGLIAILVANTVRDDADVGMLLGALLAAAVGNALFGLLQYLGLVPGGKTGGGLNAIIATMGNRNYLGGFLSYLIAPAFALLPLVRRHWGRALALIGIGFALAMALFVRQAGVRLGMAAAGLFVAFGAGLWGIVPAREDFPWWGGGAAVVLAAVGAVLGGPGVLGFLVYGVVAAVAFLWGSVLRRFRWAWIPTVAAVLLAAFLLNPATTPLAAVEKAWERNAGRVRAWDWWVGYFMWKDHPLTGIGLGGYKIHFVPYKPEFLASPAGSSYRFPIARAAQAHNEYVQLAAELGSLGLIVALAGIGLIAYVWVRRMGEAEGQRRLELLLFAGGLVALAVHAMVSFPLHLPASSLVLVVLLGLIFSPRYGVTGRFRVALRGVPLRAAVAAVLVFGLGVSVVAVRDLIADRYLFYGQLAYYRGDVRTANALFRKAVALDFFPRVSLYWLGVSYLDLGEKDKALEVFHKCLGRYVRESLYLNIAALELERGNLEAAKEFAERLLATVPPRDLENVARFIIAAVYYRGGEVAEAVKVLQDLVKRSPNFERAWVLLGEIAQSTGDMDKARSYYERALKVIDGKIARIEKRLKGGALPAQEFGRLNAELRGLKSWKRLVEERLAKLP